MSARSVAWIAGLVAAPGLAGCGGPHSAFAAPASEAARAIEGLWWILFWVSAAVFLVVLAGWTWALLRRRRGGTDVEPEGRAVPWILVAGAAIPAVILAGLMLATIRTSSQLAGAASRADALLVEVIGYQFWWEARYPDSGAVTANEIHIPVGRPVRLRLSTNDVIHSLWLPRLHGKLDLTPGHTTELLVQADEPGVYRGFCAEFCGTQHALMGLRVVAQPEAEFGRWLERAAAPAPFPAGEQAVLGQAVFTRYDCHLCHRVRGSRTGEGLVEAGPDLTHVGTRATLGAATVENTSETLAAWIRDPHRFKPGVLMPATDIPERELRALVHYLEGGR